MFALLLLAPAAAGGEAEWRGHMEAGRAAAQRRDAAAAAASFGAAVREAEQAGNEAMLSPALHQLAQALAAQGRREEAETAARRSLALLEKLFGPAHPNVAAGLMVLGNLARAAGRAAEAEPLLRRALDINEKALGPQHPGVAQAANALGALAQGQGRYADAVPLWRRVFEIGERALGAEHPEVAAAQANLAAALRGAGEYAEAEALLRRSLAAREKALGPADASVGRTLNAIGLLYLAQGRSAEARPVFERALDILGKALGPGHVELAAILTNLGSLERQRGAFGGAILHYLGAQVILEGAYGADDPRLATVLNNLGELYADDPSDPRAEQSYARSLAIREKALGPGHPELAITLQNFAVLRIRQGRGAEAAPLLERALAIRERALGGEHPRIATTLTELAFLHRAGERPEAALPLARRATRILASRFAARDDAGRAGRLAEQRARFGVFDLHVQLLQQAGGPAAGGEAFEVAQLARASDTADQVARMAARYAAGSDALAQLARERQDALARLARLESAVVQLAGEPGAEARLAAARADEAATRRALVQLDERLEREYPRYRELTDPKPLPLAAAQALLAPGEALVVFLVTGTESFAWALRRDAAAFVRVPLSRKALDDAVRRLRAQLDLGGGLRGLQRAGGDDRMGVVLPFDAGLAHELYRQLLGPLERELAGATSIILVPDGPLASLPPAVLVTEPPPKPVVGLGEHAPLAWLAKKYAVTVLPAVSSLRALREFARPPASTEPFGGFGDPVLGGAGESRGAALLSRGAVADVAEVRKLARLPESADELRTIAAALKAPAQALRLGPAATERAVKEADLARYRNLAFATHGLMAGEFQGLAEPALVLTPPEAGSALDDGLLTAGEISQLRLDADWVVLSACNTAAPDGSPGAEGFSGLAKAFFYAGARSLLVSHWAVASEATVALTTRMFEEAARGAPKAEAHRRAMLALMQEPGKPHYAHPAFWAPFVVAGEGGAAAVR